MKLKAKKKLLRKLGATSIILSRLWKN